MKPLANRLGRLGTETAFEVLSRARALERQGRSVIHLEIGEPDFDTPRYIRDAAKAALDRGCTHYTPSAGLAEIREACAEHVATTRGIPVTAENAVVVPGGKPILFYTMLALVDEGDEVVYPDPGYPIYESMIRFSGGVPVPLPLREERDFRFNPAELRSLVGPRTKLIIINSPGNPCGAVATQDELESVADAALRTDAYVLSDEIYSRILYEGKHQSVAALPGMLERTILLDGFSKTYAMTGWRLGYGIMSSDLVPWMTRLMTNSNSCCASFTQFAGIAALRGSQTEVATMVEAFRSRRDVLIQGLNEIPGISCRTPHGAFYAFPNISSLGRPAKEIADLLLEEAGVATLAGTAFGRRGEGYLRLSYANSLDNLREAVGRIREVVAKRF
ncbi:MAG: pyridoxal phosphate-dependent aminotransferase [Candidatus Bipolaricaulis sp.]|nr:pyridoxal phosphate-dependent aminotransferase [Candidatus Bipolaricaulis sp.]MDD5646819.1 pyridoxal phosphate-dependent aminotransferase [Candidatus Bipolaricaulis sp.]